MLHSLYVLPLSANDHPTMAQGFPRVTAGCRGHPKIVIFQPTHGSLNMAKSSMVTLLMVIPA